MTPTQPNRPSPSSEAAEEAAAPPAVLPTEDRPAHEAATTEKTQGSARRTAILVLGMHRSATSAVTRVINLLGADLSSNLMAAIAGNNEAGFWESLDVYRLNEDILENAGSSWDDWRRFDPGWLSSPAKDAFKDRAHAILEQDFAESSLFVFKDPRICRLLPFWLEVLRELGAEPRCVLPIRNPLEVAASLKRRDGFSPARSHMLWLRYVIDAEHGTRGLNRAFVTYDGLLDDWRHAVARMSDGLDIAWPRRSATSEVEIEQFLGHRHRHHAEDDASVFNHPEVAAWVKETYSALNELHGHPGSERAPRELDRIRAEFDLASDALGAVEIARKELAAQVTSLERTVTAREARIGALARTVSGREVRIGVLESAVSARDERIGAVQKAVRVRDTRIERVEKVAAARRARIDALQLDLASEKRQKAAIRRLKNAGLHRLNAVQTSASWQLSAPLRTGESRAPGLVRGIAVLAKLAWWTLSLRLRERLRLRRTANQLLASGLFDLPWYVEQNPDIVLHGINPIMHWVSEGWKEGRNPNPFFHIDWYLAQYPDVAAAGINPLVHYVAGGAVEGRDPCPLFDTSGYVAQNPDVTEAGLNPLAHFLTSGLKQGRKPNRLAEQAGIAGDLTKNIVDLYERVPETNESPAHRVLQVTPELIEDARNAIADSEGGSFSVVLPTWNRRNTIERAIESVLAQSFSSWELIICDDGSDDATEAFVRERYDSEIAGGRIRYLSLEHKGVSAARNAGLRATQGDWIAYIDSDNAWHAHYLLIIAAGYAQEKQRRTAYSGIQVYDESNDRRLSYCRQFEWGRLLKQNFIDLNVFSHHRGLFDQFGGFDESLTRLVDWDLILRYTRLYEPKFHPYLLADYHVAESLNNITLTQPLARNEVIVRRKCAVDVARYGAAPLRIAYVLWDWPALSQTFVLGEIQELLERGLDVRVYYAASPDITAGEVPDVVAQRVSDADELAELLVRDERNWIHSHFAYPVTTQLTWPAAEKAGIAFSFMPHAVDIFHHSNRKRSRVGEIANSPLCGRVLVYSEYHRRFLIDNGAAPEKIVMTPQAVDTRPIRVEQVRMRERQAGEPLRVLSIARFIEKKGLEDLINAAALLDPDLIEIHIFGYGPLEDTYRELIQRHGLQDRLLLKGVLEGTNAMREALRWADVFCLPCVEAKNGDVDGMPTVYFQSMAAGVPCVAGRVSAIPDFIHDGINGFLVPPRDPATLADTLKRLAAMPADALAAVAETARAWTDEHLGSRHTVDTLLDTCARAPVDLFMVTYLRDGHGDWAATQRAIRSVLDRTTTPMVLTVVDNGSDDIFLDRLRALAREDERVRLIEMGENLWCGPASNVALELAKSEHVFYVCSNEGYVARNGWERTCLRYMRNRPRVALAGRLVASPAWPDGRGYLRQDWFSDFRNPEFARSDPDRELHHVQGGLWVLRRELFQTEGGFNPRRPQQQTDVEYSYFLESRGYELGDIPGLVALSNKTRPGIEAFLDEEVIAVHPVFDETLGLVDTCTRGEVCRCNLCRWTGELQRAADGVSFDCPECGSSPRDRATFRWLAGSNLHHRNKTLDARGLGDAVRRALAAMFRIVEEGAEVRVPACPPGFPSRMLGIAPLSVVSPEDKGAPVAPVPVAEPRCNICGGTSFGPGPGGRMSVGVPLPPRCNRCQSLPRHRAFRSALDALHTSDFRTKRVLQFSQDRAVDPTWFLAHEVSEYGGPNSLDLQAIDRADAGYDLVICNHVLEHVADDRSAMRELFRIVRPDGFVFLSFPNPLHRESTTDWGYPDKSRHGHYRIYGKDVFAVLSAELPDAAILNAIATDPVTGSEDMYFLISKEMETAEALAERLTGTELIHSPPPAGTSPVAAAGNASA